MFGFLNKINGGSHAVPKGWDASVVEASSVQRRVVQHERAKFDKQAEEGGSTGAPVCP